MLNVVCVNKDNYLGHGEEYVLRLKRGVERHLKLPHTFHVVQDAPGTGWWAKLSLFEPGRFKGWCIYFDLDTLIVGSLDHFAAWRGEFAGINDFFFPELLQTGVMAWEAGTVDHIYTNWDQAGRPQFGPRGDAGFIASMVPNAQRLQNLFPSQFVSFKAHCAMGVPKGARVVCFHGLPRPHAMKQLMAHW